MYKKYQDEEGNFYDVILYTGYNVKDVIEFLDNKPITYSYSLISDQDRDETVKTSIDIIYKNDIEDHIYLFTYEYLVYDIKKNYIYTYRYELFNKLFKKVNMIEKKSITEDDSSASNVISILGTDYRLVRVPYNTNGVDECTQGICDRNLKKIIIGDTSTIDRYKDQSSPWRYKQEEATLHHEIVHAYFTECGMNSQVRHTYGPWSEDEEIVDWTAFMNRKISASFDEADKWLSDLFKQESIKI